MKALYRCLMVASLSLAGLGAEADRAAAFDVVLSSQGEYLDAYLVKPTGIERKAFVVPDDPAHGGRHINGKICFFPESAPSAYHGKLVAADDTFDEACNATVAADGASARCSRNDGGGQPNPTFVGDDPAGWAVLNNDGSWFDRRVIHTRGCEPDGQGGACDLGPASPGSVDPQGCFFDPAGNLWGTDVGHDGDFTNHDGVLVVFFAASDYRDYCIVADTLLSPAMPAYEEDILPSIYLPLSGAGQIQRLISLPLPVLTFPQSRADCPGDDHKVTFPALTIPFTLPLLSGTLTPAAIVRKPGTTNWYVASVLLPAAILEYNSLGLLVGSALPPMAMPKNPEGLDVGSDGTIYYSELNLQTDALAGEFFSTGCGSVSKYKPGDPAPTTLAEHLRFPDGITVVDSCKLDLTNLAPPSDETFCASE
jgi:hypothetical protein